MYTAEAFAKRLGMLISAYPVGANALCLDQAAHALRHEFDILGSGWVHNGYGMTAPGFEGLNYSDPSITCEAVRQSVPEAYKRRQAGQVALLARYAPEYVPIDWQIDIKSGARYQIADASGIRFGVQEGVDAKVSADMSRGYQLVVLARAWRQTGQAVYRNEAIAQLLDWMTVHPPGYGAGWRAAMNVAIRAVNWLVALAMLAPGLCPRDADDRALLDMVWESLMEHRRHIAQHLEFTELPSSLHPNHYIANLAGLMTLSAFMAPMDCEAVPWLRLAMRELGLTMRWQVNADGVDFESSTMYHAFALEMLVESLLLTARLSGEGTPVSVRAWIAAHFGEDFNAMIRRMMEALRDMIQPNGRIPVVGDADSGRFACLEDADLEDTRRVFLCAVGAALYEDASLLPAAFRPEDLCAASLLLDRLSTMRRPAGTEASAAYPVSGFYMLKNREAYAFVCCAPIGTGGLGGHSHNDRLQALLSVGENDIVIDPGVYVYTASKRYRNEYRNVAAHATVCVASMEPNRLNPPDCWWGYLDDTQCKCLAFEKADTYTRFLGEQYAYRRMDIPLTHRREVRLEEGRMIIRDWLLKDERFANEMTVDFSFMLGPSCRVTADGPVAHLQAGDTALRVTTAAGVWQAEEGFYAPRYGERAATVRLAVHMDSFVKYNEIVFSWRE